MAQVWNEVMAQMTEDMNDLARLRRALIAIVAVVAIGSACCFGYAFWLGVHA